MDGQIRDRAAAAVLCACLLFPFVLSTKNVAFVPMWPALGGTADAVPLPVAKPERRPATAWTTNDAALAIIRDSEGLRLKAYRLAGQWLIGYGHAGTARAGMRITEARAQELLRADVTDCEAAVGRIVQVHVTRNEFSAMVALCYNVGPGALARSSIVRFINAGEPERAAEAFLQWDKARLGAELVRVKHLGERRKRERDLFLAF